MLTRDAGAEHENRGKKGKSLHAADASRSRRITPMARLIACLVALGTTGVLAQAPDRARSPWKDTRWIGAVLDAYLDADAALYEKRLEGAGISNNRTDVIRVRAALELEGPLWIRQVEGEPQEKRRLVVGAVALTAANFGGLQAWRNARALIEWACELVRKNVRSGEAERIFHWAGISLLEAAADAAPLQSHVGHALQRFPSEPRFLLARGVATELRTWPDPRDGRIPRDRDPTLVGLAVTRLSEAGKLKGVGAEALTRLAFLAIRNGNPNEALPYLRDAEAAGPDPFVGHLVQLFKGRALERLDRAAEAIDAYRKAIAILPGQTAQFALAATLAKTGDHAGALAQAEAAIRSTSASTDPWFAYGRGDGRMWSDIARQLREEIRGTP